ncbi:hypothetical protein [Iodobacter sp.]|uniref:hypothetical protein n=1 Tax=Iodobacter sp. TaxID=1915058 RepID=UPI0025CF53A4|nr:hypothetical protein [Iodobacter sp.]
MKHSLALLLIGLALSGCGAEKNEAAAPKVVASSEAEIVPEPHEDVSPVSPKHWYVMRDGSEYGYERVLSKNETDQGQAAGTLIMIKYAGQKNGKHQIYLQQKEEFDVFECNEPCDYIKTMTFYGDELIRTERLKFVPGTIAASAMMDAFNGQLEVVKVQKKSKPNIDLNIWFSEKSGIVLTPVKT